MIPSSRYPNSFNAFAASRRDHRPISAGNDLSAYAMLAPFGLLPTGSLNRLLWRTPAFFRPATPGLKLAAYASIAYGYVFFQNIWRWKIVRA
jgi:hypothetical protein